MSDLKTLKDVESNLRDVAREWINYVDNFVPKNINDEKGIDYDLNWSFYHRDLLSNWIRMFFNLEDDSTK